MTAMAAANQAPRRGVLLAILIAVTSVGPVALNLPLSSMPGIADAFGVSFGYAQLVLTLYLVALALGQLVYGPLSDRFGRRAMLMTGLILYIIGSFACALAPSIEVLIAARVLQGGGGCAGMLLGRAIIQDLYGRNQAASLIGYVTMAMVVAPMVAPVIGGFLEELVGWRAGFYVAAAIGVAVLVSVQTLMPETHRERTVGAGLRPMLHAFGTLLRRPSFLYFAGIMGFTSGMFFAFLAGGPYVVVDLMQRSPSAFGLWSMVGAAGYMAGNFFSGRYTQRVGTRRMMVSGSAFVLAGMAALVILTATTTLVPVTLFLPLGIVNFGQGLVLPSAVANAVGLVPRLAGAAAGLSGAMQVGAGAIASVVVGATLAGSVTPLIVVLTVMAIVSVALVALALMIEHGQE